MGCLVIVGGIVMGAAVGMMLASVVAAIMGWGLGAWALLTMAIGPFCVVAAMCGIASGGRSWWPK